MGVTAVTDQREVVEKILRHLGLWNRTPPIAAPAPDRTRTPGVDSMTDYENVVTR